MAIYFLRHGQSEANVKKVFAGQKEDSPLTKLGVEQARQAGTELESVKLDRIISSKLKRALRTATEVAEVIGFNVEAIEIDDRLLEYDMGAYTGTPGRKLTSLELVSAEGAEDPIVFQERVMSLISEYKNKPENTLIVSHAGVGRTIEAARQGIDPKKFYDINSYPNAHVVKLELDWLKA